MLGDLVYSTTLTTLLPAGTLTSREFKMDDADSIVGSCYSDVGGSLAIQQSNNGTNWDIVKTIPYVGGTQVGIGPVEILARYGRVVYTNGAVIQGSFRLFVLKKKGASGVDFLARQASSMDFWSASQEEVAIPAVAADQALPDVVVSGLPSDCTVLRVVAMFKFRAIENTNAGANKLSGTQDIQIRDDTPGAWTDAISFVDDQFGLAASTREGGDVFIGSINLSATVIGNDTYNFQWDEAKADLASVVFNDVQVGLRVWYR